MSDQATPPTSPQPTPDPNSFDSKISQWWANNKLLFFLALPLIVVFFLRDLIFAALAGSARATTDAARADDAKLSQESSAAEIEAAKAQAQADAAAKRVADRSDSDIPEDWNKK